MIAKPSNPEPDVYVERCDQCQCPWRDIVPDYCLLENRLIPELDRRFPRWCPLLRGPVTVAAIRRTVR